MTTVARTLTRNNQDVFGSEVWLLKTRRRLSKCAVAAFVSAQHGERNKHFGRKRDACSVCSITQCAGVAHEVVKRRGHQMVNE